MRKGSFKLMKKMNQQMILGIICRKEAVSRAEIAEITELSPATVSNIVKDLIELDLVRETVRGKSRGGRKPVMLEIDAEGAYIVGLEWGIADIKAVLMDLNRKVILMKEVSVNTHKHEFFIESTKNIIKYFENNVDNPEKIFGIGIGIHGMVNPEEGISLYAPHFGWEELPIVNQLNKVIDYPVLIDNDVRMMAWAEKWEGRDDFIFINTGPGIGAGIVLNGSLHYGQEWSAGEFGHMTIVDDGPLCSCGNHGCLEALISLNRLVKEFNPDLESKLSYHKLIGEWNNLIKSAKDDQIKAQEIIKKSGRYLGKAIANVINLLDIHSVIIGGEFIEAKDIMFPVIKKQVKENSLRTTDDNIDVNSTVFGEKAGVIGAGTRVLQKVFKLKG